MDGWMVDLWVSEWEGKVDERHLLSRPRGYHSLVLSNQHRNLLPRISPIRNSHFPCSFILARSGSYFLRCRFIRESRDYWRAS